MHFCRPPHPARACGAPPPPHSGGGVRAWRYLVGSRVRLFSRVSPCCGPCGYRHGGWGRRGGGTCSPSPVSSSPDTVIHVAPARSPCAMPPSLRRRIRNGRCPRYAVTIYRYGAGSVLPADMPAESFLHRALARKSAGEIGAGKTVSHPFPVGAGRDRAERVLFRDAPYPGAGAGAAGHLRTDLAGDAAHTNPHRSIVYKPALLSLMHSTAGEVGRRADLHRPPCIPSVPLPHNLYPCKIFHRRALDHLSQGVVA